MKRRRKVIIFILGVLLASIVAIVSKSLWPSDIGDENFDSLAVKIFGFPVVASFYFLLIYSYNAAVLIKFSKLSLVSNLQTGLRFGICFGLLYLVGMQEVMVEASPCSEWGIEYITYQLIMGSGEALAALLLCLVFAKCLIDKTSNVGVLKIGIKQEIITLVVIAAAFTIERALAYETGLIASNVSSFPIPTYAWTVLFGVIMGGCFVLLFPIFSNDLTVGRRCFQIAVVILGISWMIFNSFIGFIFKGELWNLLMRSGLDVVTVFLAAWFCMTIGNKRVE